MRRPSLAVNRPVAFGMASLRELREADRFYADLTAGAGEALVESAALPAPLPAGMREPFFGDGPGDGWRVLARPGTPVGQLQLRADDLVVRRRRNRPGWRCLLAGDVDPQALVGPQGLLRGDVALLRRSPARRPVGDIIFEEQIPTTCGFYGASVVRTAQEVRDAVVARAMSEWTAWHDAAGVPRQEGDAAVFGRLLGYYLAVIRNAPPDLLVALQTAARGPINYAPLLAAGATTGTINTQAATIRAALLAGAPGTPPAGINAAVEEAVKRARQASRDSGAFSAWSAVFVSTCVRGAAVSLALESTTASGQHAGQDGLLLPATTHASYALEAHRRRQATPARTGTYHAFGPREQAPRRGDIIVQDRQATNRNNVLGFAQIGTVAGRKTHGDIVCEVGTNFVITLGGNLNPDFASHPPSVGESVLRRRYALDSQGLLVVDRTRVYMQEDTTGALPALGGAVADELHDHSTLRIFTLLSPVEDCRVIPGTPVPGGGVVA